MFMFTLMGKGIAYIQGAMEVTWEKGASAGSINDNTLQVRGTPLSPAYLFH